MPQTSSMSRGPDARARRRRRSGDRVRRGDERIRAVVDVQQRALRALEDHEPVTVERVPDEPRGVRDVRLEPVPVARVLLGHRVQVELGVLRPRAQELPLRLHRRGDLLAEDLLVEQVLHADPEPRCLVLVRGADPAPCRADLELAEPCLAALVEQQVVGHDQVRVGRDPQPARRDPAPAQPLELLEQHARVDHDAVADHRELAGVEDPGRDEVELEHLVVADDRVAGVVAALEADDHVGPLGEEVGDLSLPLVPPLGPDDDDAGHGYPAPFAPGGAGTSPPWSRHRFANFG